MPSSSMKFDESDSAKKSIKPSERRRNVNCPALSDRQKRPDMQIYVPRALRGSQGKCLPIESKKECESDICLTKDDLTKSAERPLCPENKLEKDAQVSQTVSNDGNTENSSRTKIPRIETVTDEESKNVASNSSCFFTDNQVASCQKVSSKSGTPFCSHTFEILHNHTSFKKIEVFSQIVTGNIQPKSIEPIKAFSFQDSETEIADSLNISEAISVNSNENLLKSTRKDANIAKYSDEKIVKIVTENILPKSSENALSFQDSETEIADSSNISGNISATSNKTSFREDACEPLHVAKSSNEKIDIPEIVTEHILPRSSETTLSFKNSEIEITDGTNISENISASSNKKSNKIDASKPHPVPKFSDEKIEIPQIVTENNLPKSSDITISFQDSETEIIDHSNVSENMSAISNENIFKKSIEEDASETLHVAESSNKKIEILQIVTEKKLSKSIETTLLFDDSETKITDNSNSSEDISANSNENSLKSTREDVSEPLPTAISSECPNQEKEDSWESKFDDDGECLNPEIFQELKNITGQIEVLVVKNKYTDFMPATENTKGDDTIVELYDFPREFNTQDLVSAFSQFQQSCYSIKWVDDCHALAIFSSPSIANQALMLNHPFVKTRPISEGIKESKEKARWCALHSEPVKPRPTTSAVLARRLVSGALGLRVQASKEQRDQERTILKEAKEKRRQKAKQKQAIWDGVVL